MNNKHLLSLPHFHYHLSHLTFFCPQQQERESGEADEKNKK